MFYRLVYVLAAFVLLFAALPVHASPQIGQPAPDFTATDIHGQTVKLSDLKGKNVVLEWTNDQCPYVMKHYDSGNMQKTQEIATAEGVTWISIVSSAPGLQGNVTPEEAQKIIDENNAHPTAKILDEDGSIGHLYDAQTTPHMFVIDTQGTLVYAGAIDDQPSPRPSSLEGAKNYVLAALDNLEAGQPVEVTQSQPYGCAVKYAH